MRKQIGKHPSLKLKSEFYHGVMATNSNLTTYVHRHALTCVMKKKSMHTHGTPQTEATQKQTICRLQLKRGLFSYFVTYFLQFYSNLYGFLIEIN